MKRGVLVFIILVLIVMLPSATATKFFQQHSTWYEKIPENPELMENSLNYINDVLINSRRMSISYRSWSVPVWHARADTPYIKVTSFDACCYGDEIKTNRPVKYGYDSVPIPQEAMPAPDADGHMVIISADGKHEWDFYQAKKAADGSWSATVIRRWNLTTDGINSPYDVRGSCRVCPVPLTHGLVMHDEIEKGYIDHAIAFAYWGMRTPDRGVYPCEKYNGGLSERQWAMSLGYRLQLDPELDIDSLGLNRANKIIAKALQEYGMIFVENNGPRNNGIYAERLADNPDKSWQGIMDLENFADNIPLNKFRVVKPIYPSDSPNDDPPDNCPDYSENISYYKQVVDRTYEADKSKLDSKAASNYGTRYYEFQYVLMGTLAMYEATGDEVYLERALTWMETMITKATIKDKDGYLNWGGPWENSGYTSSSIAYQLEDLQGSTELARLADLVLNDPQLNAKFGARAQKVYDFVDKQIIEKWQKRGMDTWMVNKITDESITFSDKIVLYLRILLHMNEVDGKYEDMITKLAQGFKDRFESYDHNSIIWAYGIGYGDLYDSDDTSHSNRHAYAVTDLYNYGYVFDEADLLGLSNLITKVVYQPKNGVPYFVNFLSGDDLAEGYYEKYGLGGMGQIYHGWVTLGQHNGEVQRIMDATLRAMMDGKRNNCLDRMNHELGRTALSGNLARNLKLKSGSCHVEDDNLVLEDINKDGSVDVIDLVLLVKSFGTSQHDLTGDGRVDVQDLLRLIQLI